MLKEASLERKLGALVSCEDVSIQYEGLLCNALWIEGDYRGKVGSMESDEFKLCV